MSSYIAGPLSSRRCAPMISPWSVLTMMAVVSHCPSFWPAEPGERGDFVFQLIVRANPRRFEKMSAVPRPETCIERATVSGMNMTVGMPPRACGRPVASRAAVRPLRPPDSAETGSQVDRCCLGRHARHPPYRAGHFANSPSFTRTMSSSARGRRCSRGGAARRHV